MTSAFARRIMAHRHVAHDTALRLIASEAEVNAASDSPGNGKPSMWAVTKGLMATELDAKYQAWYKSNNGPVSNLGIHWARELRYTNVIKNAS